MKNYNVYFELYGKKMKATILAENEQQAKQKILEKVMFHKVELKPKDEFNSIMDVFDMMDGFLNSKK